MTAFRISSYNYDQHARKSRIQPKDAIFGNYSLDDMTPSMSCRQTRGDEGRATNHHGHVEHDFNGVTNIMRKVSLHSHRKWRPLTAWSAEKKDSVKAPETAGTEDEQDSVCEVSRSSEHKGKPYLDRRSPNSTSKNKMSSNQFIHSTNKIRYPRYPSNESKSLFEESLPPCLKQIRAYQKYSRRELCSHTPIRSVTSLSAHQVKSKGLPHPGHDSRGRRRPWSAPPKRQVSAPRHTTGPVVRQRPASAKVTTSKVMTSSFRFEASAKQPSTPRIDEETECVEVIGRPDSANSVYSDDFEDELTADTADRTGSYHFVHQAQPKQAENVTITVHDVEEDLAEVEEEIPEEIQ